MKRNFFVMIKMAVKSCAVEKRQNLQIMTDIFSATQSIGLERLSSMQ